MYTYNILYGRCHNYRMEVEEYESTVVYRTLFCSLILFSSEGWEQITLNLLQTFLSFYNSCLCSIIVFSPTFLTFTNSIP